MKTKKEIVKKAKEIINGKEKIVFSLLYEGGKQITRFNGFFYCYGVGDSRGIDNNQFAKAVLILKRIVDRYKEYGDDSRIDFIECS